jgi:protein-S-isoprenylcysteine O-methyltransferase Ste14
MWRLLNLRALAFATAVTLILVLAFVVGSRNLQNFDAALVAYLFGTLFAAFGIAYRYAVWLQRPPTWRYFVRTWELLFSRQFSPSLALLIRDFLSAASPTRPNTNRYTGNVRTRI